MWIDKIKEIVEELIEHWRVSKDIELKIKIEWAKNVRFGIRFHN